MKKKRFAIEIEREKKGFCCFVVTAQQEKEKIKKQERVNYKEVSFFFFNVYVINQDMIQWIQFQ